MQKNNGNVQKNNKPKNKNIDHPTSWIPGAICIKTTENWDLMSRSENMLKLSNLEQGDSNFDVIRGIEQTMRETGYLGAGARDVFSSCWLSKFSQHHVWMDLSSISDCRCSESFSIDVFVVWRRGNMREKQRWLKFREISWYFMQFHTISSIPTSQASSNCRWLLTKQG